MKDMDMLCTVAYVLVLIGAINLGLHGLTNVSFLEAIFGSLLGRVLSIVIGASAGYLCYQMYLTKFKKV